MLQPEELESSGVIDARQFVVRDNKVARRVASFPDVTHRPHKDVTASPVKFAAAAICDGRWGLLSSATGGAAGGAVPGAAQPGIAGAGAEPAAAGWGNAARARPCGSADGVVRRPGEILGQLLPSSELAFAEVHWRLRAAAGRAAAVASSRPAQGGPSVRIDPPHDGLFP